MDWISLPIEIWQEILFISPFLCQIRLRQVSKIFYCRLEIHDFYDINDCYLERLTDQVLINYHFIKYLNVCNNSHVSNLNHLTKLIKLNVGDYYCGVNDQGIIQVNPIELHVNNNPKITSINHMNRLAILNAYGNSGLTDQGINALNLIELDVENNQQITNINHMTRLVRLIAGGGCVINDQGIIDVNPIELDVSDNPKVTNVNHMTKLTIT